MSGTIWQSDAVGADDGTVELGRDGARSMATEEKARKQWFLTLLSVPDIPKLVEILKRNRVTVAV